MIIAVASYSTGGPDLKFFNQVRELLSKGIASDSSFTTGISCVTLARNIQISRALKKCSEDDLLLLLDDDITFSSETIESMVEECRLFDCPISAKYCDSKGKNCFGERNIKGEKKMVAGLGCIIIPAKQLFTIAENYPDFKYLDSDETFSCFTECGVIEGQWYSEDYLLCARLGNVRISNCRVGHRKEIELWPQGD